MIIGDVIGEMVSTIKHETISNRRLLIVQPVTPEGEREGGTEIALDCVDAGVGDRVLVCREGKSAETILGKENIPVRSMIVAVVDEVELGGKTCYRKGE